MASRSNSSNTDLLTRGSRFQRRDAKRVIIKEAIFDDRARAEFLTGFQKRNQLKRQAAVERRAEVLREEKRVRRREKRRRIAAAMQKVIENSSDDADLADPTIETLIDGERTTTIEIQPLSFDI